jgi:hypothetical protein
MCYILVSTIDFRCQSDKLYGKHPFETRKVYVDRSPMLDSLLELHILPSATILAYTYFSVISYCI